MANCTKVDITQTYLKSEDDIERRIRARGIDGNYMYYLTEKKKVSNLKRIEVERRLTQKEYLSLFLLLHCLLFLRKLCELIAGG